MKGTTLISITLAILYLTTPSVLSTPIGRRDVTPPNADLNVHGVPIVNAEAGTKRKVGAGVDPGVNLGTKVGSNEENVDPNVQAGTKRDVAVNADSKLLKAKVTKPDSKRD
ncbi:6018_t:CDS:1, partial [Rhizophagus irregularis]